MMLFMAKRRQTVSISDWFEALSQTMTKLAGGTGAFGMALGIIVGWMLLGPVFHFSDTWQLVINTGTTIITFLMVFLLQRSQNKDSLAIHLKLNEIVAAIHGASNRLVDVESLSEKELDTLHRHYAELAKLARSAAHIIESHSIEEARERHSAKRGTKRAAE
jgi:low affinity Fe/Cu permease